MQLDFHAFGSVDEDLTEIGVGDIVIFVAITARLDALQRRPEFVKAEGDMIEDAGRKIGAARCQAEMDDRAFVQIEPVAGRGEGRPIALANAEYGLQKPIITGASRVSMVTWSRRGISVLPASVDGKA